MGIRDGSELDAVDLCSTFRRLRSEETVGEVPWRGLSDPSASPAVLALKLDLTGEPGICSDDERGGTIGDGSFDFGSFSSVFKVETSLNL